MCELGGIQCTMCELGGMECTMCELGGMVWDRAYTMCELGGMVWDRYNVVQLGYERPYSDNTNTVITPNLPVARPK